MRGRLRRVLGGRRGMALLLVLSLFALLTAAGAAMFFASATAVSTANRAAVQEQAALSARSFCEMLRGQLESDTPLRAAAGSLPVGSDAPLEASALPGDMGSVRGRLYRTDEYTLVAEITAEYLGQKSSLRATFSRTGAAGWTLAGYQPKR